MFILLTHSLKTVGLEGLVNLPLPIAEAFETFERSEICQQTCCSSSRLSDSQNSYSFEVRDTVFGSLPFSEFRKFGRFKRIHP